jgi:hypothetical protein
VSEYDARYEVGMALLTFRENVRDIHENELCVLSSQLMSLAEGDEGAMPLAEIVKKLRALVETEQMLLRIFLEKIKDQE